MEMVSVAQLVLENPHPEHVYPVLPLLPGMGGADESHDADSSQPSEKFPPNPSKAALTH